MSCWKYFIGALSYANIICSFAPSQTAINSMLQIRAKFGLKFRVDFISSKNHVLE